MSAIQQEIDRLTRLQTALTEAEKAEQSYRETQARVSALHAQRLDAERALEDLAAQGKALADSQQKAVAEYAASIAQARASFESDFAARKNAAEGELEASLTRLGRHYQEGEAAVKELSTQRAKLTAEVAALEEKVKGIKASIARL